MGAVSESSNCVRSLVKPALHVGKQIGGGLGWRAWAGSGGFAGGGTAEGGSELGDTLAQPVTSITGSIGISKRPIQFFLSFIGNPLHGIRAAFFFLACSFDRQPRVAFTSLTILYPHRHRRLVLGSLISQTHGLQRQQQAQGHHGGSPGHPGTEPGRNQSKHTRHQNQGS